MKKKTKRYMAGFGERKRKWEMIWLYCVQKIKKKQTKFLSSKFAFVFRKLKLIHIIIIQNFLYNLFIANLIYILILNYLHAGDHVKFFLSEKVQEE